MPDNPELIEKFEIELQQLIARMHSDGVRYEAMLFIVNEASENLRKVQTEVEKWLDSITIPPQNITGSLE